MKKLLFVCVALLIAGCESKPKLASGFASGDYHVVGIMVTPSPGVKQLPPLEQEEAMADVSSFSTHLTPMLTRDLAKMGMNRRPVWLYVEVQEMNTETTPGRKIFLGNQVTVHATVTLVDVATRAVVVVDDIDTDAGDKKGMMDAVATSFAKASRDGYIHQLAQNYDALVIKHLYP